MPRAAFLALAVGLVLADSSVVTLGLPDVLDEFDATPPAVAWVLIAYNLVLAAAALPAASFVRRHSAPRVATAGLAVFAAASLVCALSGALGVLIAARAVQGLGGAAVACGALVLLEAATGSRARGAATWAAAGALGAAVGPAIGGVLTQALSWQSIFFVQIPVALVCLPALRHAPDPIPEPPGDRRPDVRSLAALAFTGAGLTAALFLLVLLLMAGWRLSPIAAALTVSVMPLAALLGGRLPGGEPHLRAATGVVLLAGGLAALGLLPRSGVVWTFAPQVLVGVGLGLALGAVTEQALAGRTPLVVHGGWTLAARHAGVVAALALLTPLFNSDLLRQEERATVAVMAKLLDSPLQPATKLDLGLELAGQLDRTTKEVPDIDPLFAEVDATDAERPQLKALRDTVAAQLDRAATSAFERSFLAAALLSLLALAPLLWPGRR